MTRNGVVDKDGNPLGRDFVECWTMLLLIKYDEVNSIYSVTAFSKTLQSFLHHSIYRKIKNSFSLARQESLVKHMIPRLGFHSHKLRWWRMLGEQN
jgi:hypothetical protein